MNDKEFKDCIDKLVEATDSLSDMVDKMGKTIDKTLDYCMLITLIMFVTIVISILF